MNWQQQQALEAGLRILGNPHGQPLREIFLEIRGAYRMADELSVGSDDLFDVYLTAVDMYADSIKIGE